MFTLEESQLIEDNITDQNVLQLYKILRKHESSNDRATFIDNILANRACSNLTELLIDYYKTNGFFINEPSNEPCKYTVEQREAICEKLNLDLKDLASLVLVISASLLQLFVVDNFVGPNDAETVTKAYSNMPKIFRSYSELVDHKSLSKEGSEIYHQVSGPWSLKLVQLYCDFLASLGCSRRLLELEFLVWKHRFLTIYLMVFLEQPESVVNELKKIQEFIFDHHVINCTKENNTQLVRFNTVELCCELAQSALLRSGITSSRKFIDYACEISGLSIEHTGMLGKRTKFQQKDIPQLLVKVSKKGNQDNEKVLADLNVRSSDLPADIELDDDTLLPDISFVQEVESGESVSRDQDLSIEAQILMLSKLDLALKTEVMEESLKDEWTLAYLRWITKSASTWSIMYKSLAMRSMTEKKHSRKMERALLQMEELIKSIQNSRSRANDRMKSFYSTLNSSSWQTQRSLGDMSSELGLYKAALDIYLRIEYWEGVIKCYCALGQTIKAEKIIRQELQKQETPYLHCLLGDVTDNIDHYEKSWTLSNCRFARAKKSIGTYHYVRKQFDEAISNYEVALTVNPSNVSILSLLGYCCLITEKYERAAECYRNITYQDDSNFLAWNNLSKAYIKLNQKERAWHTLREALKSNFEEWKIWENFMLVSIQIGALDDVIAAWHRLIDIKTSHKDDEILQALTFELVARPQSQVDSSYRKLLRESIKLVARLNTSSASSPFVWTCYVKLLLKEINLQDSRPSEVTLTNLDIDARASKVSNALQRATPSLIAETDWFKSPEKIVKILDSFNELADCYLLAIETLGPRLELWRQFNYFKLSVRNLKNYVDKKLFVPN